MDIRVRYAPSPTGLQHIGGIRTALFDYFYARSKNGKFILRVEDTDRERFDPRSLQDIYDTFAWLGIEWDEGPDKGGDFGPYIQTERKKIYAQYISKLIESGSAYKCFTTAEELDILRKEQTEAGKSVGYDRRHRNLTEEEIKEYENAGRKPVIRFKVPLDGTTAFNDAILGVISKANADLSPDPVLLKTDGFPTYNFANVIDDHLMEISHVFRGQEYVPSTPLYVLIYKALGWEPPVFCHLPFVVGKDGQKLSKRHGATSIIQFRDQGYLPEALINFVMLLGWSYDDSRELFSIKDLEELFSLEKVNKAPAVFDYQKLEWFNGMYIREKNDDELYRLVLPYFQKAGLVADPPASAEEDTLRQAVPLIKERLKVLSDAPNVAGFLFRRQENYSPGDLIPKKGDEETAKTALRALEDLMGDFFDRTDEENEQIVRERAKELGIKLGQLLMPLRVAMTGSNVSPPLFESLRILGKDEVLTRLRTALSKLS
ncbi:MAG: glutamate--tRNA ligase [Spirochaetia bacterium]